MQIFWNVLEKAEIASIPTLLFVIVKKSKHKLLLSHCYQNLLCYNMCSGLRINDLVISPSPSLPTRCYIYLPPAAANFLYPSLFEITSIKRRVFQCIFYWLTRNTVNMMMYNVMCSPVVSEVIRMFNDSQKGSREFQIQQFNT